MRLPPINAARGRPWLVGEIGRRLSGNETGPGPDRGERRDTVLTHFDGLLSLYGHDTGLRVSRKHIGWYARQEVAGRKIGNRLLIRLLDTTNRSTDAHEVRRAIMDFYEMAHEDLAA